MTQAPPTSRDRLASIAAPRASAIPAAMRHSKRVARLRFLIRYGAGAILAVCLTLVGVKALKFLPADFRFSHIGVQGSRITLDNPKLTGYRKDGRPYDLTARTGVQDLGKPDLFDLEGVAAKLDSGPGQAVMLTANAGLYNTKTDQADLSKGVRIFDDKSYDLQLETALLDMRANTLNSDRPGKLLMNCCEVEGNKVELAQNEQRVTFIGGVHSTFYGEKEEGAEKSTGE